MSTLTYLPDQEGYSLSDGVASVMVELEGGAPFIRKDQLGTWGEVDVQWTLNPTEYEGFRSFYKTTISDGSLPFEMYLIVDSITPTLHQAIFVPGTVKFPTHSGRTYTISATVKFNPTVYVP